MVTIDLNPAELDDLSEAIDIACGILREGPHPDTDEYNRMADRLDSLAERLHGLAGTL